MAEQELPRSLKPYSQESAYRDTFSFLFNQASKINLHEREEDKAIELRSIDLYHKLVSKLHVVFGRSTLKMIEIC